MKPFFDGNFFRKSLLGFCIFFSFINRKCFYCDHVKIQCNLPQRFQKTNKTMTKSAMKFKEDKYRSVVRADHAA